MDVLKLEQSLLDCWSILDDIETIISMVDTLSIHPEAADELINTLLGIKTLYHYKFLELYYNVME